jgi:hypothetical protein
MPFYEYISVPLEEGIIVARRGSCKLFMIAGSARFVWESKADGVPEVKIPALLARHYRINLAQAEQDVRDVLRLWNNEGLIISKGAHRKYRLAKVGFSIRYEDGDVEVALGPMLEHLVQDAAFSSNEYQPEFYVGMFGGEFRMRTDYGETLHSIVPDEIVERLFGSIVKFAYEKVDWLFSVHGSAVATENACVLMPGPSGSGKSTLAAGMVARGYDYVADDLVMFDRPTMRAIPLPMPIVLKSGSWDALEPFILELSSIHPSRRFNQDVKYWTPDKNHITRGPLPIHAVVFPTYRPQATATIVKLSPFETLSRFADASCVMNPPANPESIIQLASWVRSFPAYSLTYGSLSTAITAIREQLN